ncbi:MAG TPA: cytochrome c [Gemmatimonadaceae bacterium]|nr:cytochrome c [Gemmatimonadaceae bacterium]
MRFSAFPALASRTAVALLLAGCSDDDDGASPAASADAAPPPFQVVATNGTPLSVFAGDTVQLRVIATAPDGGTTDLPDGAVVTWTDPFVAEAIPVDVDPSTAPADPFPLAGSDPSAAFIDNPGRPDVNTTNVLYVLDPGTIQNGAITVSASLSGAVSGTATGTIAVVPAPAGDWNRGATTYANNCAVCHGATGHGTPVNADGTTYTLEGQSFAYPAPGLNAEPGNLASDPAWNVALLAVSARADIDNGGVTLRAPMPDWNVVPNTATGALLTTQDFADIYAYLKTQAQ